MRLGGRSIAVAAVLTVVATGAADAQRRKTPYYASIAAGEARSIIYRADLDGLRTLMLFLVKDCCAGNAELCAPLIAELAPCC